MKSSILLISGPSGSGKSTLIRRLMSEFKNTYFSVSSTTRAPRDGEIHGVNYFFLSEDEFKKGIENDEFIEWANVHGNFYGTSIRQIENALNEGKFVILDIDVQGFKIVEKKLSNLTTVFVTTANLAELRRRLETRGTDDEKTIEKRLKNACGEMEFVKDYDFLVINDDLDAAYEKLRAIFLSTCAKTANLGVDFIKNWKN